MLFSSSSQRWKYVTPDRHEQWVKVVLTIPFHPVVQLTQVLLYWTSWNHYKAQKYHKAIITGVVLSIAFICRFIFLVVNTRKQSTLLTIIRKTLGYLQMWGTQLFSFPFYQSHQPGWFSGEESYDGKNTNLKKRLNPNQLVSNCVTKINEYIFLNLFTPSSFVK